MIQENQVRLKMENIHKRFGATVALSGVSIEARAGEVLALVGENGAGKSTLMKILSGAIKADSGSMTLDGRAYNPPGPFEGRRAGVAMIYQELSLASHLSVEENIMLGMEPCCAGVINGREVRQRALEALEFFGVKNIAPNEKTANLSVAEQQIVEIARALAIGCKVLVLDEPTSSLTGKDVEQLFDLIKRLKAQGQTLIYISHFIEEVRRIADRVTVLRDGQSVVTSNIKDIDASQIVAQMVGREVHDLYPRSERTAGTPILEIRNLAGNKIPVKAGLTLHRGEVVGIAGLVGAGRTEFLRAIFGLDQIKNGDIKVAGFSGAAGPAQRWRQGMGLLSENRKEEGLALPLSIADNITLSQLNELGPANLVLPSRQHKAGQKWIERLAIRCQHPGQPVQSLSGGNQQKVALARLLHHDVDIFLLDEPTRGIDVAAKAVIYQIIDDLACQNKAVLIVSSYLPELMGTCDRIAVMCRGKLGPARCVAELNEQELMLEATGQEISA